MKTLNDYILDAQSKEARFLKSEAIAEHTQAQWKAYANSRNTTQKASDVLQANYTTTDGIPCHNRATSDFYSRNK